MTTFAIMEEPLLYAIAISGKSNNLMVKKKLFHILGGPITFLLTVQILLRNFAQIHL